MKNKIIKKMILFVMFLVASLNANLAMASFKIPDELTIKQHFFSLTSTFDLLDNDLKVGLVNRKLFSLRLEYEFYDLEERLKAKGRLRWISLGAVFDVTDFEDKPLGSIREHIISFFPTFSIFSPSDVKLAEASLNFWGTKYTFRDPLTNREIAVLSRPFFRIFTDEWTLKISDQMPFKEQRINSTLFVLIAAFQTDRDYWSGQSDDLFKSKSKVSSPAEQKNMIQTLRCEIDSYRDQIEEIEPDMDDLNMIDELVDAQLSSEREVYLASKHERMIFGLNKIMPLLEGDLLTPPQKYGLYVQIEQMIQEFEKSL